MAFFGNAAVNLLNLHYALHHMAIAGGGAFYVVYLLKAGLTAPQVLLAVAAVLAGRFTLRPLIVGFAVRHGLRRLLMAGTILTALQYPVLAEVSGVGGRLFALIALSAVADMIYWTCYHAYFAALGDDEARGRQLGAREAIVALIGVISPLVAGWLLATSGPRLAFAVSGLIAALSALPLLRTPDVAIVPAAPPVLDTARPGILLFAADGWMAAGFGFVWQILLFRSLGESYVAFGGALALAALVAALLSPWLGSLIDSGHGMRAVLAAVGVFAAVIVFRAAAVGDALLAVAANASGALVTALYMPTLMTQVYTQAKNSPCPLRFHVATEGGWDVGGAGGTLAAALVLWLGGPGELAILLALAGLCVTVLVTRTYYATRSLARAG